MPLTLVITEGLVPKQQHAPTMARLSQAFLDVHGLSGNAFLTPHVIGHVEVVPQGSTFSGLKPTAIAIVEWLVPSFAFTSREAQIAYVERATQIVFEACEGRHPREHIWVNVQHAVDGSWGIGGKAYTNAELGAAVSRG